LATLQIGANLIYKQGRARNFLLEGPNLMTNILVTFILIITQLYIDNIDKRLFQCGSQEAGLVKYDKYT